MSIGRDAEWIHIRGGYAAGAVVAAGDLDDFVLSWGFQRDWSVVKRRP